MTSWLLSFLHHSTLTFCLCLLTTPHPADAMHPQTAYGKDSSGVRYLLSPLLKGAQPALTMPRQHREKEGSCFKAGRLTSTASQVTPAGAECCNQQSLG